jgi:hypothetical protein
MSRHDRLLFLIMDDATDDGEHNVGADDSDDSANSKNISSLVAEWPASNVDEPHSHSHTAPVPHSELPVITDGDQIDALHTSERESVELLTSISEFDTSQDDGAYGDSLESNHVHIASDTVTVEDAFKYIQEGNDNASVESHWEATSSFYQACKVLDQLAHDLTLSSSDMRSENDAKICALYQQQSKEYFHRSREALIQAMRDEYDADRQTRDQNDANEDEDNEGEESFVFASLTDEEKHQRCMLFGFLFANVPDGHVAIHANQEEAVTEDVHTAVDSGLVETAASPAIPYTIPPIQTDQTLEQRLAKLNESIPSSFKSADERMSDLTKGLNRLGISTFSYADEMKKAEGSIRASNLYGYTSESMGISSFPKSESDQVDAILAQARDEVALGIHLHQMDTRSATLSGVHYDNVLDPVENDKNILNLLTDEDNESDASGEDTVLDANHIKFPRSAVDTIRECIADAQTELALVMAQLNESSLDEAESNTVDDATIDASAIAQLQQARIKLQQARNALVNKTSIS